MKPCVMLALIVSSALNLGSPLTWADDDPREIERANKLLLEVSDAYSKLPVLTDVMTTTFAMTGGRTDQNSTIRVRLSKSAAEATGIVPPRTLDVHAVGGYLYLQLKGAKGAVKTPIGDDPLARAKKVMGIAYPYLPPQLVLRWTNGIDDLGDAFSLGMLEKSVVAGYALVEVDGGAKRHEVLFKGSTPLLRGSPGTCRVQIDPETKLVMGIAIESGMEGADRTLKMTAAFKPQTPARLSAPIAIDLGENFLQHVDFNSLLSASLGGIEPTIKVGAAAPSFELVDQNGKKHTSSAYRGKIIMLDWWGVWCSACQRDMPKVQALHEKYSDNPDFVILAMNVRDDNKKMAEYWAEKKYSFPTLNDADDLARQYGIKAYPSTILIGPDGTVILTAVGSVSSIEEKIEKAIEAIR